MVDELVLPDYGGACIANIVPALLGPPDETPAWMPAEVPGAHQVVLFVVDGLGWEQLQTRRDLTPTLAAMSGGPVTTVAPSTTSTALTSLTTGLPPGEHGVVGYRMAVHGEVLNVLRWSTAAGDAHQSIPPSKLQPNAPFDFDFNGTPVKAGSETVICVELPWPVRAPRSFVVKTSLKVS